MLLPLGILLLCYSFLAHQAEAEQCRLVLKDDLQSPTNPGTGSDDGLNATGPHGSNPSSPSTPGNTSSQPTLTPFNYGKDKIRGVNLGGWFVLEPWITPSIFQNTNDTSIIDEYTMGQKLDKNVVTRILTQHWDTWITEDDFKTMSAAGLNHVRIPLGYWSVPLTSSDTNGSTSVAPYTPGAWPYLLRALNWARAHNIHVILDLHGAPGSQNGYDNSGQRTGNPVWGSTPADVSRTIDTLVFIAKNIGGMVDVIELLNEAAGWKGDDWAAVIRQFWLDGYAAVRNAAGDNLQIMIGDAFLTVNSWPNFLTYPNAINVLMDYHEYQIFSIPELSRSFDDHISFACSTMSNLVSYSSNNLWTIIGEWSNALTDCAKWLNGRGIGARWDGSISSDPGLGSCQGMSGDSSTFSSSYKKQLRQYWEVQTEIGENIQGWVFWTWKAENADEWSYEKGLQGGWIPYDPTERQFPNQCK